MFVFEFHAMHMCLNAVVHENVCVLVFMIPEFEVPRFCVCRYVLACGFVMVLVCIYFY